MRSSQREGAIADALVHQQLVERSENALTEATREDEVVHFGGQYVGVTSESDVNAVSIILN